MATLVRDDVVEEVGFVGVVGDEVGGRIGAGWLDSAPSFAGEGAVRCDEDRLAGQLLNLAKQGTGFGQDIGI